MKLLSYSQELVRRINEDEAAKTEFERLRLLRRLTAPLATLPDDITDQLDWQQALAICRTTRAISQHLS